MINDYDTVWKAGKVMVADEIELIETAKIHAADVVKRAGIQLPKRFQ